MRIPNGRRSSHKRRSQPLKTIPCPRGRTSPRKRRVRATRASRSARARPRPGPADTLAVGHIDCLRAPLPAQPRDRRVEHGEHFVLGFRGVSGTASTGGLAFRSRQPPSLVL
jgi:hypothetical protein